MDSDEEIAPIASAAYDIFAVIITARERLFEVQTYLMPDHRIFRSICKDILEGRES
jgi:hypothetical protein